MVITTAQLHSAKPELRICTGSNAAVGVSETWEDEDLWQWSQLQIRLNTFVTLVGQSCHRNNSSSSTSSSSLKFTKFIMPFFEPRVSFSSNVASFISFLRDNSSVLFHLELYMFSKKRIHQNANYQTFNCSHEYQASSLYHFQATSQFSFKFCITFLCYDTKFLWNFLAEL